MFELSEQVELFNGALKAHYEDVLTHIFPLLTEERQKKITNVVNARCFNISVVLESIYDHSNTNAIMRSAKKLRFSNFHIIKTFEKFKETMLNGMMDKIVFTDREELLK